MYILCTLVVKLRARIVFEYLILFMHCQISLDLTDFEQNRLIASKDEITQKYHYDNPCIPFIDILREASEIFFLQIF